VRGRNAGGDSEREAARLASPQVTETVCNKGLVLNWLHASGIALLDLSLSAQLSVPVLSCDMSMGLTQHLWTCTHSPSWCLTPYACWLQYVM
jgi:hypothetical protein